MRGLQVRKEVGLRLSHKEVELEAGYRIDLLVNDKVLLEIKSVAKLVEVRHKQVLTYLKLSGMRPGLLVNFNTTDILKCIYRKANCL